jgi:hypothetical protein
MKKIFALAAALVAGTAFLGIILSVQKAVAQAAEQTFQPAIREASSDKEQYVAGETAVVNAVLAGGKTARKVSLSCELLTLKSGGGQFLWSRSYGETFELKSGETVEKKVECSIPENIKAQELSSLKIIATNELGCELSARNVPIGLKDGGQSVLLENGLWQLRKWLPPSDGKEPIKAAYNIYVGENPQVIYTAENPGSTSRDVFLRALFFPISDASKAVIQDGQIIALGAGQKEDAVITLPELEKTGIFQLSLQLMDGKTKDPVSNILDGKMYVKGKIGDPFEVIVDAGLDKSQYVKGEKAIANIKLEGSGTYIDGEKTYEISARIASNSKTVGTYSKTVPMESTNLYVEIPVTEDVSNPTLSVSAERNGEVLSEYVVNGDDAVKPADKSVTTAPAKGFGTDKMLGWMLIIVLAIAAIVIAAILIMRNKKAKPGSLTLLLFLAGAASLIQFSIPQSAEALCFSCFTSTIYTYDGRAESGFWTPVNGKTWKGGDSVNFTGGINPVGAAGSKVDSITIKFYVSKDINIPTYDCGGGRQCLNTAGQEIYLLGQLTPGGVYDPYNFNQTFALPAQIDNWSGNLRLWLEETSRVRIWHPDCCDGSYTSYHSGWGLHYVTGRILGNDAR